MRITFILVIVLLAQISHAQDWRIAPENPIELGKVNWLRDYNMALAQAQDSDKPIFLLFQEVPGCSNCTQYGTAVLSHPLMVEAIETSFVPLVIYNNKKGEDAKILQKYNEPAWNNPVVRILNSRGDNIVARIANFRSQTLLVSSMINALDQHSNSVPEYLRLLLNEWQLENDNTEEAYLSMYCFWTGEQVISQLPGVVSTEAGFMHGKEVVKVNYNSSQTSLENIATEAHKSKCADQVFVNGAFEGNIKSRKVGNYKKDKEDKYYLRHSLYRNVPMISTQLTAVNGAIGRKENPDRYLSQRQLMFLTIEQEEVAFDDPIHQNWWKK